MVCSWRYSHSRLAFCELTRIALDDRTGAIRFFLAVLSRPSMKTSSRSTWKLYVVKLRLSTSPSLCKAGRLALAFIERWQPKQLVIHDEWHAQQDIRSSLCARRSGAALARPHVTPSFSMVLASRSFSL